MALFFDDGDCVRQLFALFTQLPGAGSPSFDLRARGLPGCACRHDGNQSLMDFVEPGFRAGRIGGELEAQIVETILRRSDSGVEELLLFRLGVRGGFIAMVCVAGVCLAGRAGLIEFATGGGELLFEVGEGGGEGGTGLGCGPVLVGRWCGRGGGPGRPRGKNARDGVRSGRGSCGVGVNEPYAERFGGRLGECEAGAKFADAVVHVGGGEKRRFGQGGDDRIGEDGLGEGDGGLRCLDEAGIDLLRGGGVEGQDGGVCGLGGAAMLPGEDACAHGDGEKDGEKLLSQRHWRSSMISKDGRQISRPGALRELP